MVDFLNVTTRNNLMLIKISTALHQKGQVPPNTYVIDLDSIRNNARIIKKAADDANISLYFMSKQFGRNPIVSRAIVNSGIEKAVAVSVEEAKILHKHGIPVGHVGHLVQIPKSDVENVLKMKPEVITVFSIEKARQISKVAKKLNLMQNLLVRVVGKKDFFYPYQEGGFPEEKIVNVIKKINRFENVKVVGVTSFPCLFYNEKLGRIEPTPNFDTILRAADRLEKGLSVEIQQINAPKDNCASTIPLLAEKGATHGEPGHALTGTTPLHVLTNQPEIPAYVYVSEVSHLSGNKAYCFGGGFYSRHNPDAALVSSDPDTITERKVLVENIEPGSIDYYATLRLKPKVSVKIGDTVIFSFRTQMFVTRANIAVVDGIQRGKPKILGLFDGNGSLIVD